MIHHPSLDGLRGVAVLMVVLFHNGILLPGWIGVQLFFVLSGFLITQGLVETKGYDWGLYFKRFYWRRSLRIFPLNYGVLLVAALAYLLAGVPSGFDRALPFLLTYTTNFLRMTEADAPACFVHFWSLAVEEQFYLVWPLLVFFCSSSSFRKLLVVILAAGPLFRWGLALALNGSRFDVEHTAKLIYLNPFSHFDAFATGAAVAIFPVVRQFGRRSYLLGGFTVWLLIGCTHIVVRHLQGGVDWRTGGYPLYMAHNYQFVWGYTLINGVCGLAVAYCVSCQSPARILVQPWLMYVGRVSYGVYVFHFPILLIKETLFAPPNGTVHRILDFTLYLAVTLSVSALSFTYFEEPFLKLKNRYFSPLPVRAMHTTGT